jgi:hypothetical protein
MKLLSSSLALLCLVMLAPGWALAESIIDYGMVSPTAGTISYAGGSAPLVGSGIQVDNVVGLATPANNFVTRNCLNCFLSFTTGNLLQADATGWKFGGGGSITISGTVDLNNNNVADAGDAFGPLLTDIVAATPEPITIVLLGTVLLGWGILGRRRLAKGMNP